MEDCRRSFRITLAPRGTQQFELCDCRRSQMIDDVAPRIRVELVLAKARAMTDGADIGLRRLEAIQRWENLSVIDRVAIGLLESELHSLDLKPRAAMDV